MASRVELISDTPKGGICGRGDESLSSVTTNCLTSLSEVRVIITAAVAGMSAVHLAEST